MARLTLNCVVLAVAACGNGGPPAGMDESSTGGVTTVSGSTGTTAEVPTSGEPPTSGTSGISGTVGETEGATTTTSGTDTTAQVTVTEGMTTTTTGDSSSTGTSEPVCPMGTIECVDGEAKVCDGMGGHGDGEPCEGPCVDGVGCLLCNPGEYKCEGEVSMQCADDGLTWGVHEACDAVQGVSCNPQVGLCDGVCALENLQLSYIGCDYWPTVTLQHDSYNSGTKIFAAVVANTTMSEAKVTVTRGANVVKEFVVPPGSVATQSLPWVPALTKGLGPTALVEDGAYRLRSNQPVTVYQYNLLYADASNDTSLLLPVNAWTGDYVVASYGHAANNQYPGFYAVVAARDDTTVTLSPSATGGKVQAGGGVAADGTGQVVLQAGDVLEVMTAAGGDLTGTRVAADGPVQVIAGHKCTQVPGNVQLCDHLEEAMFPLEALAQEYLVVPPVQSPDAMKDHGQVVRVIASADDTTLTFTPDQGAPTNLAKAGDFVELVSTTAKFKVAADKKILVSQYMVGQGGGFGQQDPSMLLAVATEQYREDYLFHAPTSWTVNFVDIILKSGTMVAVDGVPVVGFVKIPQTEYSVAHVQLSNAGDGNHTIEASDRVGISVYGIQDFGSYWAVGGLDLDHL
jgi:hypothetical protein